MRVTPSWWTVRSARYWLVVGAAAPLGLLLGVLLTSHFARPPANPTGRAAGARGNIAAGPRPSAVESATPHADQLQTTAAQNAAFVRAVYQDVIGAAPPQGTVEGWLGALDSGASRTQVAAALLATPERATHFANSTFQELLGRDADSTAVSAWVAALEAGAPPEQLYAGVLGSDEYYQQHGGTDTAWLDAVFLTLLGREPTPAERDGQLAALSGGAQRADVANALSHGDEYRNRLLADLFRQYLGRAPDADEQRWLVGALAAGQSSDAIRAALLGSDEYLHRNTGA
ncbi:MAG TPA: DUF4214 domain-containing protein [Dehalococcoidia bacterium]